MIKNVEISELTLKTMVYFIFGFTIDEDKKTILKKVVNKAFADATNQGAYNTLIDKDNEDLKEKSKEAKDNGKEFVVNLLLEYSEYSEKRDVTDYKTWHNQACSDLKKIFCNVNGENSDKEKFSYGNAQKVINMSMKYLYMLSTIPDFKNGYDISKLLTKIYDDAEFLEIPIDSYIIDAIKETDTSKSIEVSKEGWSKWNDNDYIKVRDKIPDIIKCIPLNWEMEHWIIQAKERRKKQ